MRTWPRLNHALFGSGGETSEYRSPHLVVHNSTSQIPILLIVRILLLLPAPAALPASSWSFAASRPRPSAQHSFRDGPSASRLSGQRPRSAGTQIDCWLAARPPAPPPLARSSMVAPTNNSTTKLICSSRSFRQTAHEAASFLTPPHHEHGTVHSSAPGGSFTGRRARRAHQQGHQIHRCRRRPSARRPR